MIVIGGMIGLGKTTTASLLSKELSLPVFYEKVDDNKVLPLYYSATAEDSIKNRYPFLLQLTFLSSRYKAIKEALILDNAVMDRSIYEDHYFAIKNHELGRMSDLELEIYEDLLNEMMSDIKGMKSKKPDFMIYLKGSFDTVIKRIKERGRSFEIDDNLLSYYKFIHQDYDDFVYNSYKESPIFTVDVDKVDLLNNLKDREELILKIKEFYK